MKYTIGYPNLFIRILIALAASVIIVHFGSGINFLEALLIPSFYYSIAGSFVIAFLLVSWVHFVSRKMDEKSALDHNWPQRIALRIIFGFAVPAIGAYLLAAIYFSLFGIDIRETDYMLLDYSPILWMLALLNFYYHLSFKSMKAKTARITYQTESHSFPTPNKQDAITADEFKIHTLAIHNGNIYLNPVKDIAYFFHTSEIYRLKTFEGKIYTIATTLKEIEEKYSPEQFFRLNKNVIINLNAIDSFSQKKGSRSLDIHLKAGLIDEKDESYEELFSLNKNKISAFKKWLDR